MIFKNPIIPPDESKMHIYLILLCCVVLSFVGTFHHSKTNPKVSSDDYHIVTYMVEGKELDCIGLRQQSKLTCNWEKWNKLQE